MYRKGIRDNREGERMENIKVEEWLENSGKGSGKGSGDGSGKGSVYGDGYGDGSGYGYGSGYGSGYGDGYGIGDGSGIAFFDGKKVYVVDNVQTIFTHMKDSVAKGFILNFDFTLTPCFVVKGHGYFAHGKTLEEAMQSLQEKIFEDMDTEETIGMFLDKFKKGEKYEGTEFFEWHHHLTGSCLMGRESFVKNHGLDVNALYTVDEFISICENDYGSEVIKELKERWNEQ